MKAQNQFVPPGMQRHAAKKKKRKNPTGRLLSPLQLTGILSQSFALLF